MMVYGEFYMIKYFAWLFPLIFIFHDMEEIIGMSTFLRMNKKFLEEKYPFIISTYRDFSTEGFALAVYEELIFCIVLTVLFVFLDSTIVYYLWFGAFIGCTIHFLVHIVQFLVIKRYIPAVITSIFCLPLSCYMIRMYLVIGGFWSIFWIFIGFILVFVNLVLIQNVIGWFTRKMGIDPII